MKNHSLMIHLWCHLVFCLFVCIRENRETMLERYFVDNRPISCVCVWSEQKILTLCELARSTQASDCINLNILSNRNTRILFVFFFFRSIFIGKNWLLFIFFVAYCLFVKVFTVNSSFVYCSIIVLFYFFHFNFNCYCKQCLVKVYFICKQYRNS